jgi:hypothetical protein
MANKKIVSFSMKEKNDEYYSDLSKKSKIPKSRIYDGIIEDFGGEWVRKNIKI